MPSPLQASSPRRLSCLARRASAHTALPVPRASARNVWRWTSVPGFTLIELLLAIVLLALVVSLTYAAMFQVTTGARYLTDSYSDDQELRLLLRMLAQDLGSVQYLKNYVAATATGAAATPGAATPTGTPHQSGLIATSRFTATSDFSAVDFHAAVRSRQNRQAPEGSDPMLHEVGYSVREDVTTHVLQLVRREDYYIDDQMQVGGVTAVLASGVEVFWVECLQPAAASGQTQETWTKEWNSNTQPDAARLPAALRITFGVAGKNGRHLKETVEVNLLAGIQVQ
jgi:prepilin-type N-terminal cleavage/methylation domain-containing protein